MELQDLLSRFGVALGIGLLIGLERGWRARDESSGSRAAGIRTFAISSLLGAVVGALALLLGGAGSAGSAILIGLSFIAYAGAITVFCLEENRADKTFSATTAIAALVTFALGVYALIGDLRIAGAVAVGVAIILAMRESLHGWVAHITWSELRSGLVLLAMTVIALPIVPDMSIGPYNSVNPREVWLIAIILAGVSFLGYAAVKYLGQARGILLAGAAGGFVSSTVVTISNARRAVEHPGSSRILAAGAATANAVMYLRIMILAIALNQSLTLYLAPALTAAAIVALGFALAAARWRGESHDLEDVAFRNPFSFWSVIGFALLLAVVVVAGRIVGERFGSTGAIVGAAVAGLFNLDVITVSMARLVPEPLGARSAAIAIMTAVATDAGCKVVIGAVVGRGRFATHVAVMAVACFASGGLVLWLMTALVQ
jgi:uncharacterized membrane protein (DUF4010 family)